MSASGDVDGQTNNGRGDAFISKYTSDGSKQWTQLLGTSEYDNGSSISTADDGSIYIAGDTYGNLDVQTNSGSMDAFISKFTFKANAHPTDISTSVSSFSENITAASTVATLSRTDPDTADAHTYSLVSGDGDTDNRSFTIDGNQLKINASPDHETQESYSVRLRTTDSGGLNFEKSFTFAVNDFSMRIQQIFWSQHPPLMKISLQIQLLQP